MERNQAIGLVLIFGILFAYLNFFGPEPSELPSQVKKEKEKKEKVAEDQRAEAAQAKETLSRLGLADSGLGFVEKEIVLENEDVRYTFSSIGGKFKSIELKKYKTFEKKPLMLVSKGRALQKLEIPYNGQSLNVFDLPFDSKAGLLKAEKDTVKLELTCALGEGKSVKQIFSLAPKGFSLGYHLNTNGFNFPDKSKVNLQFVWNPNQLEKDIAQNRTTACINYLETDKGFNNLSETSLTEEKADISSPIKWISFKQKFFNLGLIAEGEFSSAKLVQKTDEADSTSVKRMEASVAILIQNQGIAFQYFAGPNQFKLLKKVATDYDKNVYLGWPVINLVNRFITVNVFYWLQDVIPNYGVIIIILVLLIKLILFPLSYKSYISMAKMKVLKPELDEIKERTGDDMQKAQAEQMKLYQQVGINPLSGCIPLLLQMPILLAVFNFFPNAIELRQESFLWAPDLSSYDSVLDLPFSIPGYGSHVSLFTILMTASTLVLTWYNNQTTTVQGPMQSMSYIMPVVFMFILNSLPSGLSFYYLVSNVVSIVQQQFIKSFVDEGVIRRKLEVNKVKNANKKKTGFAARLEEAMRMAQEAQKDKAKQKKRK
jgi:YidC/Oxa1 family membrane protein insertase